ncbi:hypothetical protein B0H16DRAFT_797746 [Mycena metata]|uniref:Uncharacterized protein n=1 Tax=Mycena metata TaxID=1033252 RepID=A0AAD7GJN8_9AGAR|nr:hypothetical protein B0H16DRAFT_797746 [Mycena metata]
MRLCGGQSLISDSKGRFRVPDKPTKEHEKSCARVDARRPSSKHGCCVKLPQVCENAGRYILANGKRACAKHNWRCNASWARKKVEGPVGETEEERRVREVAHADDPETFILTRDYDLHEDDDDDHPSCHANCPKDAKSARVCPCDGNIHLFCRQHYNRLRTRESDARPAASFRRGVARNTPKKSTAPEVECPREAAIMHILRHRLRNSWVRCASCRGFFNFVSCHTRQRLVVEHGHGPNAKVRDFTCHRCNGIRDLLDQAKEVHGSLGPPARDEILAAVLVPTDVDPEFSDWEAWLAAWLDLRKNRHLSRFPAQWSCQDHTRWVKYLISKTRTRPGWGLDHDHVSGAPRRWFKVEKERTRNARYGRLERAGRVCAWRVCEGCDASTLPAAFETAYNEAVRRLLDEACDALESCSNPQRPLDRLFEAVEATRAGSRILDSIETAAARKALVSEFTPHFAALDALLHSGPILAPLLGRFALLSL